MEVAPADPAADHHQQRDRGTTAPPAAAWADSTTCLGTVVGVWEAAAHGRDRQQVCYSRGVRRYNCTVGAAPYSASDRTTQQHIPCATSLLSAPILSTIASTMCYSCIAHTWLEVAPLVLEQQHNVAATPELLASFTSLASVIKSGATFDHDDHSNGHANPLTFATSVVAEQMMDCIRNDSASLPPERMLRFLPSIAQNEHRGRSQSVWQSNGRAVTGVGQMPVALNQLNTMLSKDEQQCSA